MTQREIAHAVGAVTAESSRRGCLRRIRVLKALCPDGIVLHERPLDEWEDWLSGLREEISSADWSKIGAVLGLLWYKLDRMIDLRQQSLQSLKHIERNTGK